MNGQKLKKVKSYKTREFLLQMLEKHKSHPQHNTVHFKAKGAAS